MAGQTGVDPKRNTSKEVLERMRRVVEFELLRFANNRGICVRALGREEVTAAFTAY